MKKVININFQGRVVLIEEDAYENLKQYVESLRRHFADEEGADEIINDIENRISELFAEVIKKGAPCVSEKDLADIIASIGRPEDFDEEENPDAHRQTDTTEQQKTDPTAPKRFFRDENNKKIGGVCAGIANYCNVDPTVVRLIALVLLVFYGVGFVPYIILWIAVPSSATQVIGSTHKRLYRDLSHKTIGGVCAGLANYFNVSIWIPKVIFLIGIFVSFPIALFARMAGTFLFPGINGMFLTLYVILWAVVPAAITTSDKLSMKGENVDLNSIKNTVQEDLGSDKKKIGNTAGNTVPDTNLVPVKSRSTLGDIFITLVKIFAYFILGMILISIIAALATAGVALFGLSQFKDFVIGGVWQNTLAYLAFFLLIWIPIIGIIIWIIRKLTHTKSSRPLRILFVSLWFVGLISALSLVASVYKDVRYFSDPVTQIVPVTQPQNGKLDINFISKNYHYPFWSFFSISPRYRMSSVINQNGVRLSERITTNQPMGNSIILNNVKIQIVRASSDSFYVTTYKFAAGNSESDADLNAKKIDYSGVAQSDSVLNIQNYFSINKNDKFRNQRVQIIIGVPVGKKFIIHSADDGDNGFYLFSDEDNSFLNIEPLDWRFNTEYLMTESGLQSTGTPVNDDADKSIDSLQEQIRQRREQLQDKRQQIQEQMEELKEKLQELKQS